MQRILDYLTELSEEFSNDGNEDMARVIVILRACFEEVFEYAKDF